MRALRKIVVTFVLLGLVAAGFPAPAGAQGRERPALSLIRDSEIEDIIRRLAEPIFQVAGVSPNAVSIYLVNDPSLNAFVAGGQNLFLHTGLLTQARNPSELIGVIAHETGHIAGGHIARGQDALETAQQTALLTSLLGIAAAVASGNAGAGAAVVTGGATMAERSFLGYTRSMENAADQAAMTYMDRAGLSSEGMLSFLEMLADEELVPSSRQVAYARTHPLSRDRVEAVRAHVARSPLSGRPMPPGTEEAFERMQAKLIGFLTPHIALRRYSAEDTSVAARYGRAIALYRRNDIGNALSQLNQLLRQEPNNPYLYELIGQISLEHGRIPEARQAYQRAAQLRPDDALILVALAQAKLATDNPADNRSAIADLTRAVTIDRGATPMAWRLLATAHGRAGDIGMASVALAEEALAQGNQAAARQQSERALRTLRQGSAGWLRAQDIQREAEQRERERRR